MSSKIDLSENASSPGTPSSGKLSLYAKTDGNLYAKNDSGTETNLTSGGGGGAPTDATYILQVADGDLANAQALSALSTGLVKVTTTTGVLSTAVAADVPDLPASKITSGELSVERGGTGVATLADGGLLRGAGTSDVEVITGSTIDDIPSWNGTDYVNTQPTIRQLAAGELGSASASISISSIPSTYSALRLVLYVRSAVAATSDTVLIQCNSDTTAGNYRGSLGGAAGTSAVGLDNNGTLASICYLFSTGASSPGLRFASCDVLIPNYAETTNYKNAVGANGGLYQALGSGNSFAYVCSGTWASASAISSIQIKASGGNLAAGTAYALYGLK